MLNRVSTEKGVEMMGIHKAATLDETNKFQYMKNKATKYIAAMSTCPLPPHEAWLCYVTVYCLSITYLLSTTLLTAKQIDSLHTLVTLCILPRMGINFPPPKQWCIDQNTLEESASSTYKHFD
eukprot:2734241-Ditylum_brightwellii.AAC.1